MANLPIGLQLYSVRQECAHSLSRVLEAVAKFGYTGVEFAGYYNYSAADLRKILDDNGLRCCGTHTGLDTLGGDALKATIEFNLDLGNPYLIVPGLSEEHRNSRAAWLRTADRFNEIAVRLAPHGLRTGYHNHWIEFQELDDAPAGAGELPWDTFFGHTRPAVIMQLDTGNALRGGAQSQPILERYPGRAATVHLKEYSATNEQAIIGEGDVHWSDVFALCESIGRTEWYIVEQETYAYPPLECVDRCLRALRAMGK